MGENEMARPWKTEEERLAYIRERGGTAQWRAEVEKEFKNAMEIMANDCRMYRVKDAEGEYCCSSNCPMKGVCGKMSDIPAYWVDEDD